MTLQKPPKAILAFKKGDYLIDFGQVFIVTQIKKDQDHGDLLIFSPFYKDDNQSLVTSSIPVGNLDKTTIRKPLTKNEMTEVLSFLSDKKIKNDLVVIDVLTAKSVLNLNQADEIAKTIRKIFLEKNSEKVKFTGSKNYIYQLLIRRLSEEVSLVFNISLEKAQSRILNSLIKK